MTINLNFALIWNLNVDESASHIDAKNVRFLAVCEFLNQVIGEESYDKSAIFSCEWFKRKNIIQVSCLKNF